MNILEFIKKFPDDQSCKNYLKDLRHDTGITCKTCNIVTKHYWLNAVEKFQCSVCKSRTNLKAGTILMDSKIAMQKWFMCMHLITTTKKPFSALELQRQLDFKRYEPIWEMMLKIRVAMGERDSKYQLNGDIEIDDA